MSAAYDEYLVPAVFRPYAEDLASASSAAPTAGRARARCGDGLLTRAITAKLPGARVTATDLNVAMVDVGSAQVPAATWRQADAMQLPFGDASVDLVACQFGVMFFPDRPMAYAEVARVTQTRWALLVQLLGAAGYPRRRGDSHHSPRRELPRRPAEFPRPGAPRLPRRGPRHHRPETAASRYTRRDRPARLHARTAPPTSRAGYRPQAACPGAPRSSSTRRPSWSSIDFLAGSSWPPRSTALSRGRLSAPQLPSLTRSGAAVRTLVASSEDHC